MGYLNKSQNGVALYLAIAILAILLGIALGISSILLGLLPDFLAQRKNKGQSFDFSRWLKMGAIGGLSGAVFLRGLYNLQDWIFPGSGPIQTLKKVALDAFGYAPSFQSLFYVITSWQPGKSLKESLSGTRKYLNTILPVNWIYWSFCNSLLYGFIPTDSKVYISALFNVIWFSFLSGEVHDEVPGE